MAWNRIGKRRQRVELWGNTLTKDSALQDVETPERLATYWAEVRPLNGREAIVAKQLRGDVSHMVTLRFDPARKPTPEHWFQFNGRKLAILAVLDVEERHRELNVVCNEVVAGG